MGNNMNAVCSKTSAEMQADYPNPCTYYKLDGEEYCWLIGSNTFVKNATQHKINQVLQCFYNSSVQALKVSCDYCQLWYTRQKSTFKPNNTVFYSPVRAEQYCGDTVRTLFQGRQIVLRETNDSLIVLQFSNNGIV